MTRPRTDWPCGLDDLVEALADTLYVPRPLRATPETERQLHTLLRDRLAHARDALLSLRGEVERPDLERLAGWVYVHAAESPYKAVWDGQWRPGCAASPRSTRPADTTCVRRTPGTTAITCPCAGTGGRHRG